MPSPTLRFALLLFCALAFFQLSLRGGHIVGGDFTYRCLGFINDDPSTNIKRYACRINMYRDCIGQGAYFDGLDNSTVADPNLGLSSPAHISIYRGNTLFQPTLSILLGPVTDVPVNVGNPCLILTQEVCQQIGIYEFEVELPVSDEAYTLAYQRCCRNGEITNLVGPTEIGTTYFATITPEAQVRCNDSPQFNQDPPIAVCVNADFEIDLGATDANGDSLVYRICTPVLGGGLDGLGSNQTQTTFDDVIPLIESPPPYQPAPFRAPQFDVDYQLGQGSSLTIDPTTGLLRGTPIFLGVFVLTVCVEEWSRGPVPVLLSETKREFQVSTHICDNLVRAAVSKIGPDAAGSSSLEQCGLGKDLTYDASIGGDLIQEYAWSLVTPNGTITSDERNFTTTLLTPGTYAGALVVNPSAFFKSCRDTANFNLDVLPGSTADFTPTVEGNTVAFVSDSPKANELRWDFGDGVTSTELNPLHTFNAPGSYTVALVTFNDACTDTLRWEFEFVDPNNVQELAMRGINFYPNPTEGLLYLNGPASITAVFDLRGRRINSFRSQEIDLSNTPKGTYIVWITAGEKTYSVRIVKQ
ncbi:MAG: PKD domain-containing protein [Bacteroidota bacterium]